MLKVVKFGGSSMANAAQCRKVADIVHSDSGRRVVIVSAAGKRYGDDHKITDLLYLCHAHVQYGVPCDSVWDIIVSRYLEIRNELGLELDLETEFAAIKERLDHKTITQDELASRGEYFAARIMAALLGFRFVDAADWVKFNMDGTVDKPASYAALQSMVQGQGIVTPGFYGVMPGGAVRTFSRGGSDITGALAAAALDADVYENWTDVSGLLMADPRIIENPQPIAEITYDELRELSYAGAQVLHEDTVFPVREKGIPVNIRNTNDPEDKGTILREQFETEEDPDRVITGVTGKKGFSVITVFKRGMTSEVGAFRRILQVPEKYGIPVDFVVNGIDNISLVISSAALEASRYAILAEIQRDAQPDKLHVVDQIAVIAAVGHRMTSRPGVSGLIFAKMGEAGINIRTINQGPEERNIIFGVDNRNFEEAIRILYHSFVKQEELV